MGEAQLFSRLVDTLKAYAGCSPFEATYSASGSSRSARMLFAVSAKKLNGRLQYRRASAVLQQAVFKNENGEEAKLDFSKAIAEGPVVKGELEKKLLEFGFRTPHSAELLA